MIYDVVIIGTGIAGLSSSLQAAKHGRVLVITKTKLLESNSNLAQGGIAGVFEHGDNFQKHIRDTLNAGANHNNKKAVKYFVQHAPQAIKNLEKLGVHFEKNSSGAFAQNLEAGHDHHRIVHSADHTGKTIIQTLAKLIKKTREITVWKKSFAIDLLVKNKTCYGMKISRHGKIRPVFARRIILATGGIGQLYEQTTNSKTATGDGIALAARAGCKMQDLEFIQFHPTAFSKSKSPLFLISETLRGAGAKLLNSSGKRFMPKYHKAAELAPRDIVSRAIFEEQKKGPVFLDSRHIPTSTLKKMFPSIFAHLKKNGYDLSKNLIPITPAAHYLCGGIATDIQGKTNIKNLYAIGEVACTGLHGANRLASNSLLEGAVMGEHVMDTPLPPVAKKFPVIQTHKKTLSSPKIHHQIQKIMWKNVGIIRNKKSLTHALQQIKKLQKKHPQENMLLTAELITKSALKRTKSLGAHYLI